MTNTLHRYGRAESFKDDVIIFAIPCKGKNEQGAVDKLKTFLRICARHEPANMGNGDWGSYRPSKELRPTVHWKRDSSADYGSVIEGVTKSGTVAAVFETRNKAEACFKDVIDADLGLSVNISTSVEDAKQTGEACGIKRHSIEYSLGFTDPHGHLPNSQTLELATMCGHGMVSFNMAKKMLDMVREGRRTSDQAVTTLARFCPCGVYNPARAKRLLEQSRKHQS